MAMVKSDSTRDSASSPLPRERARATKGGVLAGLVGGLVLSIFMLVMNVVTGQDVWVGAKFAALPFLGIDRVMHPGFEAGPVALGTASHFAVSAAWGLVFGLIFYDFGKTATVVAGAFWGVVVWLGMHYLVLPMIGAGQVASTIPTSTAVLEHVLFGVSVALAFLPFQRVRSEPPVHGPAPVGH